MPLSQIQLTSSTGRRNLVINGGMQIFQRAIGATTAGSTYETADRFLTNHSSDGAFTTERSTDNPFGTGYSLKAQVTSADTSIAATQYAQLRHKIEAQNCQHLLYGTSSAKTLTLSFWVKSNKTGTYSIMLRKTDSTAYLFPHEYTISSANTWEKKVITISPTAGSTSFITSSSGAITNDNGIGLEIFFNLANGSTYNVGTSNVWTSNGNAFATSNQLNWMDSTSNNFYLTQVQLEVGSVSEFEHRSFGEELSLCQRYFKRIEVGNNIRISTSAFADTTSRARFVIYHNPEMRSTPTVAETNLDLADTSGNQDIDAIATVGSGDLNDVIITRSAGSHSTGDILQVHTGGNTAKLDFIAEL